MKYTATYLFTLLFVFHFSSAMSVEELREAIDDKEAILLVDVRSNALYQQSHIPGAINMPLWNIENQAFFPKNKTLVLYGDGLGSFSAKEACDTIRIKHKIDGVDYLVGGFALWLGVDGASSEQAGVKKKNSSAISYQNLLESDDSSIIILDATSQNAYAASSSSEGVENSSEELNDAFENLSASLGGRPIIRIPQDSSVKAARATTQLAESLCVVVASSEEEAKKTQERLKSAGYHRVVILVGGEEILLRGGRSGLGRIEQHASGSFSEK